MFFFEECALACEYCVERLHVCFYDGRVFCLRYGREDGHGASEGNVSVVVEFNGFGDENGVVIWRWVWEAETIVGKERRRCWRRRRRRRKVDGW